MIILGTSILVPVYGAVREVETDKQFYVKGDSIVISGIDDNAPSLVTIVFRDSNGAPVSVTGTTSSLPDGAFSLNFTRSDDFTKKGIYNITAFTETQPSSKAAFVLIDFSLDGLPIVPSAFAPKVSINPISNEIVNEGTKLSFSVTVVDPSSLDKSPTFSLEDNPSGSTINSSTGLFSWTPTGTQGPKTYTFVVVASDGTSTDKKNITITVNEVMSQPVPEIPVIQEPKQTPTPNVPDFVDPEKGAQHYLDRYNTDTFY